MKKDSKMMELYMRSIEIQRFKKQYPTIATMMASRLGEFEKRNSIYLSKLDSMIHKLFEENVSKDDKEEFEYEEVEGKKTEKPKYFSEAHSKKFDEGWKEVMESHCQIII